jgi:hypothetical protein
MDEAASHELQLEIIRRMSPGAKLDAAMRLYWSARQLKTAALRRDHPDWSEEELTKAVNESFLYARD